MHTDQTVGEDEQCCKYVEDNLQEGVDLPQLGRTRLGEIALQGFVDGEGERKKSDNAARWHSATKRGIEFFRSERFTEKNVEASNKK